MEEVKAARGGIQSAADLKKRAEARFRAGKLEAAAEAFTLLIQMQEQAMASVCHGESGQAEVSGAASVVGDEGV
jgi:hypothetical protein